MGVVESARRGIVSGVDPDRPAERSRLGVVPAAKRKQHVALADRIGDVHVDRIDDAVVRNFEVALVPGDGRSGRVVGIGTRVLVRDQVAVSSADGFSDEDPDARDGRGFARGEARRSNLVVRVEVGVTRRILVDHEKRLARAHLFALEIFHHHQGGAVGDVGRPLVEEDFGNPARRRRQDVHGGSATGLVLSPGDDVPDRDFGVRCNNQFDQGRLGFRTHERAAR